MDTIIFKLTFCLSLAFAEFTAENGQWTSQSPVTVQDVLNNKTKETSLNSPEQSIATVTTASPDTILTSMADDNTSTTVTNSSHAQTLESTTAMKPSKSTLIMSTAVTAQTEAHSTTTTAAATTTANSSVVTATFTSVLSTRGPRLNISERNLTIIFSFMLGLFALALVALKIHGWSHKLQFLHQSLRDTEELTSSTEDPDTFRGLSDGHPIYDNVPPPVRQDEAQFSLGFLH